MRFKIEIYGFVRKNLDAFNEEDILEVVPIYSLSAKNGFFCNWKPVTRSIDLDKLKSLATQCANFKTIKI